MKHNLNVLSKQIFEANKKKGFYDSEKNIGEMLALIHSEVSEALEAHRNNSFSGQLQIDNRRRLLETLCSDNEMFIKDFKAISKDTFEDEIADTIIRCLDLCGFMNIDIDTHIEAKLRFNSLRAYKHGKKY